MNRAKAKSHAVYLTKIVQKSINADELMFLRTSTTYNEFSGEITIKFHFVEPKSEESTLKPKDPATMEQYVQSGLAGVGELVWAFWDDDEYFLARIIRKARNGRYAVEFLDDGSKYRMPYSKTHFIHPITKQPISK